MNPYKDLDNIAVGTVRPDSSIGTETTTHSSAGTITDLAASIATHPAAATITATATTTSPASRSAPPRAGTSQVVRGARYAASATAVTLSKGMFLFFTIAMPVGMFLLFNSLFGHQQAGATTSGALIMIRMAAYGGMGAAINSGALIQLERTNGWLRQLMVAGLTPQAFVIGRMAAGMAVVLPVLVAVYLSGFAFAGVRIEPSAAITSILLLWVGMIPMMLLGLVIALAMKPSAAQPVITIGMMLLAVVGGLWMPHEFFPGWLQTVSDFLPSRWLGELGIWPTGGTGFSGTGLIVLIAWTVVLAAAAGLLLGRAARTTPRR